MVPCTAAQRQAHMLAPVCGEQGGARRVLPRSWSAAPDLLPPPPHCLTRRSNPLAATEYVNDIYSYYKRVENKYRVAPDYMNSQVRPGGRQASVGGGEGGGGLRPPQITFRAPAPAGLRASRVEAGSCIVSLLPLRRRAHPSLLLNKHHRRRTSTSRCAPS